MVKKNRTCERCSYTCATPQKLRSHLKRKNPCRPQFRKHFPGVVLIDD
ncbi:9384_t:CDS:1, partial [Entrophospora sp. SA101]